MAGARRFAALLLALALAFALPAAAGAQDPGRRDVVRIAGADRVATAVAASAATFPGGADTVVIASARSFPDALTSAPLATRHDGPILLVGDRIGRAVRDEIVRLGAREAVVVGGVAAVNAVVQSELAALGLDVRRLPGEDRFDTAAQIARDLGPSVSGEVGVAFGGGFADALAAGPLAADHGIPLLLVQRDRVPRDTAEAVQALRADATLVFGGEQVVSRSVARSLPAPRRLFGADRAATSVAIAEEILERGGALQTVYVATGRNYPDAAVAGPVAASTRGPLLLVDGSDPAAAGVTYAFLDARPEVARVVIFGGPTAVDTAVEQRLARPGGGG